MLQTSTKFGYIARPADQANPPGLISGSYSAETINRCLPNPEEFGCPRKNFIDLALPDAPIRESVDEDGDRTGKSFAFIRAGGRARITWKFRETPGEMGEMPDKLNVRLFRTGYSKNAASPNARMWVADTYTESENSGEVWVNIPPFSPAYASGTPDEDGIHETWNLAVTEASSTNQLQYGPNSPFGIFAAEMRGIMLDAPVDNAAMGVVGGPAIRSAKFAPGETVNVHWEAAKDFNGPFDLSLWCDYPTTRWTQAVVSPGITVTAAGAGSASDMTVRTATLTVPKLGWYESLTKKQPHDADSTCVAVVAPAGYGHAMATSMLPITNAFSTAYHASVSGAEQPAMASGGFMGAAFTGAGRLGSGFASSSGSGPGPASNTEPGVVAATVIGAIFMAVLLALAVLVVRKRAAAAA